MFFYQPNLTIIATHGAGSGNAPALSFDSVGHLRVAFIKILKVKSHEQLRTRCKDSCTD